MFAQFVVEYSLTFSEHFCCEAYFDFFALLTLPVAQMELESFKDLPDFHDLEYSQEDDADNDELSYVRYFQNPDIIQALIYDSYNMIYFI